MTPIFVDTSAILAFLVANDAAHRRASRAFANLRRDRARLLTTSYVLVETYALLGRRLGAEWVRRFRESWEPLLEVVWVERRRHDAALDLLVEKGATFSLVDACSLMVMREHGLRRAFAFDAHFVAAGFELVE
ncbi:MAG: PIN domain-containing protein [Deltaproteobacteria bacterium]|nr:PIN domain-containing protein [Deltaproteobacteria bacterium]